MVSGQIAPLSVGRYRPIATLGEGGMARVLLTVSSGPAGVRKLLVVKQIRPELAQDAEFVAMFLDEARLAARLSHPNVIHTYEVGIGDDGPFIGMEYLDGQSLQALIAKVKRPNVPLAVHLRILTKVLAGLHYAHDLRDYNGTPLSVVHRDVSPQNVIVCYDGQVKVVDFGVAKVAGSADRTAAGFFKGKIGYIAPEQLSGGSVDRRADVFSVGVMLWEALAKRRLTADETAATIVHKRLHGTLPSVKEINPEIPSKLAAICGSATALAPGERYSTAAQLQEALEAYLDVFGLRADDRDIGALVSGAFEPERSQISEVIEQHIGRASEGKIRVGIPNLGAPSSSSSPPGLGLASSPPSFTATSPGFGTSNHRRVAVISSVALAVVVIVLVARWRAGPRPSSSAAAVPGPSSTSATITNVLPNAPDRTTIALTIQVTPPKAIVSLDGAPLARNPFRSAVPKDTKTHTLGARAPGYASEERLLEYTEDATINLVLKRLPPRGGQPGVAPAPGSELKKAPRPKATIDEEDPYQ